MPHLTEPEFAELIGVIVAQRGLHEVQAALLRSNAVVSRRRIADRDAAARHLYSLTAGLARDSQPTRVVYALWERAIEGKISDDDQRALEAIAGRINACLAKDETVAPGRDAELREALRDYGSLLTSRIGAESARLMMLLQAVPAVASIVREGA